MFTADRRALEKTSVDYSTGAWFAFCYFFTEQVYNIWFWW